MTTAIDDAPTGLVSNRIRTRMKEFCGLDSATGPRCVFLCALESGDGAFGHWGFASVHEPHELESMAARGADLTRSLWDTGRLLVFMDVDYFNWDHPGEAFAHPADTFLKLEPVYGGIGEVLDAFGMKMLDLVTGAGYAFVGALKLEGRIAKRLASLAPGTPPWHATHARRRPPWAPAIDEPHARAYFGLGMALEYFAHQVLAETASRCPIPVVINNTEVGSGIIGRECVSLDLTHLGDPLDTRLVRIAFSGYQKHRMHPELVGAAVAGLDPLVIVPRRRRPFASFLEMGRDEAAAEREAARGRARIPDLERGMSRLLDAYEDSRLRAWHQRYYETPPLPKEAWGTKYDRLDTSDLPPCAAACLERPDDLLLKPVHLQLLVRVLLARGWRARHIAELVQSRYERKDIWGGHWRRIDPATRADFDVRMFAGLVFAGLDRGVDFNCVSTREKGLCSGSGCGRDLRNERTQLLSREGV